MAKRQLAAARAARARLAALPDLTAEQQAQVATIRATLGVAIADLKGLLANQPVVTAPIKVVKTTALRVRATDTRRHLCDHDRMRFGDRSWDRDRFWDGFRH
jgi:hypothetical protein